MSTPPKVPSIEELVAKIGLLPIQWAGNCYSVACTLVEKAGVPGTPVYGHYLGPVAPNSFFDRPARRALGFVAHGWIRDDGWIIDPTRWVFEDAEPYVFVGPQFEYERTDYDEGGNKLRAAMAKPPPPYGPEECGARKGRLVPVDLTLSPDARAHLNTLFGDDRGPTLSRVFWLANLPPAYLGYYARDIYEGLVKAGHEAAIPLDNYRMILGRR